MNQRNFVIIDTETTGLDPRLGNQIVQISAVVLDYSSLREHHHGRYNIFIQPDSDIKIAKGAMRAAGDSILKAQKEGISRKTALTHFNNWVWSLNPAGKGTLQPIFTGYNVNFDRDFIWYEMYKYGVWNKSEDSPFSSMSFDIFQTVFEMFEIDYSTESMSLNSIAAKLGIKRESKTHDALEDCLLSADIMRALIKQSRKNASRQGFQISELPKG